MFYNSCFVKQNKKRTGSSQQQQKAKNEKIETKSHMQRVIGEYSRNNFKTLKKNIASTDFVKRLLLCSKRIASKMQYGRMQRFLCGWGVLVCAIPSQSHPRLDLPPLSMYRSGPSKWEQAKATFHGNWKIFKSFFANLLGGQSQLRIPPAAGAEAHSTMGGSDYVKTELQHRFVLSVSSYWFWITPKLLFCCCGSVVVMVMIIYLSFLLLFLFMFVHLSPLLVLCLVIGYFHTRLNCSLRSDWSIRMKSMERAVWRELEWCQSDGLGRKGWKSRQYTSGAQVSFSIVPDPYGDEKVEEDRT